MQTTRAVRIAKASSARRTRRHWHHTQQLRVPGKTNYKTQIATSTGNLEGFYGI